MNYLPHVHKVAFRKIYPLSICHQQKREEASLLYIIRFRFRLKNAAELLSIFIIIKVPIQYIYILSAILISYA